MSGRGWVTGSVTDTDSPKDKSVRVGDDSLPVSGGDIPTAGGQTEEIEAAARQLQPFRVFSH